MYNLNYFRCSYKLYFLFYLKKTSLCFFASCLKIFTGVTQNHFKEMFNLYYKFVYDCFMPPQDIFEFLYHP